MLRLLTMRNRRRAGWWLALSYLACIIATPLGMTFADAAVAAHCLLDEYHMVAPVQAQEGGSARYQAALMHAHAAMLHEHAGMGNKHAVMRHTMMHDHAGMVSDQGTQQRSPQTQQHEPDSPGKMAVATCCGLFCVTGSTVAIEIPADPAARAGAIQPMLTAALGGLAPHRIDRPPIILASL